MTGHPSAAEILDRAQAAREVSIVAALALMKTEGDPVAALEILEDPLLRTPPETADELDCLTMAVRPRPGENIAPSLGAQADDLLERYE